MHSSSGCDIRLVGHDQYFVNKTEEYKVGWNGIDPEEGNGNPLQYCCLENYMDRGAWRATVHGVAKSQT